MGSTSSKFKKYIQNGDEYAAMQIYQSSPELKKSFDPNLSYGESRNHNTAMHYAARYGMKHLLRTFLNDLGGDPNKRNAFDETVLHSACSIGAIFPPANNHISISCVQLTSTGGNNSTLNNGSGNNVHEGAGVLTASAQERRAACIALLLQWRGARLPSSDEKEQVQMDALDKDGDSALHLASAAGMVGCVRLLLSSGAKTLIRDARGRTAAQRALIAGHARLAALIERAMIFSEESINWCSEQWGWTAAEISEEEAEEAFAASGATSADSHEGLRPQELREAKDRLLVDTSDMLRVSLFTAEALLRDNEWCRDLLVERWMKDATACCQSAGVSLPGGSLDSEHPEEATAVGEHKTIECGICCEEVSVTEAGGGGCGHAFCSRCWERYLRGRVCEGEPRPVCPAPRCRRAAPHHLLQRCLTPRTQRKYLLFDIKAFVESSRGMKWCPVAGCGRAVKLHETELTIPAVAAKESDEEFPDGYPPVSRGVDCGDFHFFCWECNGEPHPPLGCGAWSRWNTRAGAAPTAPLTTATVGAESAASSLWLLAHCKPCPSCSCPIQKNDGCNHMKCTKCKFDFCWICLESWKRHGSATGGYFRCTREEASARAEQSRNIALAKARIQNGEAQEQWRFAVQCARYRRHEQRWQTERPLLVLTPSKVKALDPINASDGILEAAARETGLCRRVLIGCCAYTLLLPVTAPHRAAFFYAQEELERCTQRLSGLIACEVIEAPLTSIKRATAASRRWRLTTMRLVRPPPPPTALSAQELRMMARLLGRGRLDPRDPWRFPLGPRGEPLRVTDPLDPDHTILQEPQSTASPSRIPERSTPANDTDVYRINVSEYNMDLIIALEMSRLQMLEEQARRGQESDGSTTSQDTTLTRNRQRPARLNISVSIGASSENEDKCLSDDQLKLAIQLSLQDPNGCFVNDSKIDTDKSGESSMSNVSTHYSETGMLQSKINDSNASWSITKERRDIVQREVIDSHLSNRARLYEQDENWSRAADITVGYFLKALGKTPLDLSNLAVGLDVLGHKQDIISKDLHRKMDDGSEQRDEQYATTSGISRFINYYNEGLKTRPPLLRSGGAQRPPLLRQMEGKIRRSWSMGDISTKSSSIDEANKADEFAEPNDYPQDNFREITTLPHCSKLKVNEKTNTETKCIQIDVQMEESNHKEHRKDENRKKLTNYPKNLPWGQFCCEKKCVKTERYAEKDKINNSRTNIVMPETETPQKISVDCRGKINTNIFDFNEKTIHLPDLNSSHLKVNTHLTKLAVNRHIGLNESPKHYLNQNEIIGDNFRRHSDHIPRTSDHETKVKASSSERHIGEQKRSGYNADLVYDRLKMKKSDSPKKKAPALSIKICDMEKSSDENSGKCKRGLETDSSNECESETGIPKSPTLYISGVSICREPPLKGSNSKIDFRMSNEQKSPKTRQKVVWKEHKETSSILATSPVIVHVTSPSLSPCSERNAVDGSSYPLGSPELYSPSLLRSTTPTSPNKECRQTHLSNDSLNILDVPVLPPSHFSDDVFYDDDDPGLMMDGTGDLRDSGANQCSFRGAMYGRCLGNMAFGPLKTDILNKSMFNIDYMKPKVKKEEALYENIYPQTEQLVFDMSLPSSPTNAMKNGQNMQKSWSARPLLNNQDLDECQMISKLKSKSANEPERDREMFHFPKSSTDGALSSVLHVQESNLSSDDFHEALFLLERSPKTRDSKRRKRSKKRDREKADFNKRFEVKNDTYNENVKTDKKDETDKCCNLENDSPLIDQDEASSAL